MFDVINADWFNAGLQFLCTLPKNQRFTNSNPRFFCSKDTKTQSCTKEYLLRIFVSLGLGGDHVNSSQFPCKMKGFF
jgi:hypothetical protein